MIRELEKRDHNAVCDIVNRNWRSVYNGFVDPLLLNDKGCAEHSRELTADFTSGRLTERVCEEDGTVIGMISFGKTDETDFPNAFEIWRLYVTENAQGRGIGGELLDYAEKYAVTHGYAKVFIWAFKENARAVTFYRQHGYIADKEVYLEDYKAVGIRLAKKL